MSNKGVIGLERLRRLQDVSGRMVDAFHSQDEPQALTQILEEIRQLFDCEQSLLYMLDFGFPGQLQLVTRCNVNRSDGPREVNEKLSIPVDLKLGLTALKTGSYYSTLLVPLTNRKNLLIGLIRLDNKGYSQRDLQLEFDDSDLLLMKILGAHLSSILDKSRQATGVRSLATKIGSATSVQDVLDAIVQTSRGLTDAARCRIAIPNGKPNTLAWRSAFGASDFEIGEKVQNDLLMQQWTRAVSMSLTTQEIPSIDLEDISTNVDLQCLSCDGNKVSVILRAQRRPVGILWLEAKESGCFDAIDRSWLRQMVSIFDSSVVNSSVPAIQTQFLDAEQIERVSTLESLLNCIPLVMWRKNMAGRYTWVNQAFCREFERDYIDIVGMCDKEFFSDALCARYAKGDTIAMNVGRFEDSQEPYQPDKSIRQRSIHVIKTAVYDQDGNLIGTQGVFIDVTTSKYRALLDQAPTGFLELDQDGKIDHMNETELRLLGYEQHEVHGKLFTDIVAASDKKLFDRLFNSLSTWPTPSNQSEDKIPLNLRKKNGELLPIMLIVRSMVSGTGRRLLCVVNGLRVEVGIEESLREPDKEYLDQIRELDLPVFCVGDDLKTNFYNAEYERREKVNPIGKKSSEVFPGELGTQYDEDNEQVLKDGVVLDRVEMHPTTNGAEKAVRALKFPLKDGAIVVGLQCVYWDYDDNDKALALLRDAYLKSIINKTKKERESFLRMLSHQLRSPIWQAFERANRQVEELDPNGDLLQKGKANADLKKAAQLRGLARKARSVAYNTDMFSRIAEIGDVPLRHTSLFPARLLAKLAREAAVDQQAIRRVTSSFADRIGKASPVPDFEVEVIEPFWWVRNRIQGELSLVEQAVGNLIDNAFKYSIQNSTIEIELGVRQDEAVLLIRNQSPEELWIDDEVLANCRKREWRSKGAIASDTDGTGLGLWLVDRIMVAHKGELIIRKTDQEGWNQFELKFTLESSF